MFLKQFTFLLIKAYISNSLNLGNLVEQIYAGKEIEE